LKEGRIIAFFICFFPFFLWLFG
jgi:hypothetical protein